ncbi:hypothetical protein IM40_05340 [Candidatus Paracaedimonas acanthamoebae]|nr:hypothetical protein IM40_05340 [Candidatus Paracaedimonas acanthamoebae]
MALNLKIKTLFLIVTIQFLHLTSANATNNLAIKLDVTDQAQGILNKMKTVAGLPQQTHKFHCTVGFIEGIQSTEAKTLAEKIQAKLQSQLPNPIEFDVNAITRPFNSNIIGLVPTVESRNKLIEFNKIVANVVKEITQGRYTLNAFTSTNYVPHISLANVAVANPDKALATFNQDLQTMKANKKGRFFLKLGTVSHTVMTVKK